MLFIIFDSDSFPNATSNTTDTALENGYRYALVAIYAVVLVTGICGIILMINILKSNLRSVTTMAVLNLIVVHALFLLTVPFRIYFYATDHWPLGPGFCKFISVMIHGHMYIAFIFYVIILAVRYVTFFSQRDRLEFYRRVHALAASLAVWVVILGVFLPATIVQYGADDDTNSTQCFDFGGALKTTRVATINYLLCAVLLLLTLVLLAVQLWILGVMYKKYGNTALSRQEFWAQIKSLCFVMIIVLFFATYHAFRIYYVTKFLKNDNCSLHLLHGKNEIFLAMTAFSCCDMLILIDRKRWHSIRSQYCICL